MWLKSALWIGWYLLKYLVMVLIVGGIATAFLPVAGPFIGLLLLIGSFPAAYDDFKEEKWPQLMAQNAKKVYKKLGHEFQGFDEALRIARKQMRTQK